MAALHEKLFLMAWTSTVLNIIRKSDLYTIKSLQINLLTLRSLAKLMHIDTWWRVTYNQTFRGQATHPTPPSLK